MAQEGDDAGAGGAGGAGGASSASGLVRGRLTEGDVGRTLIGLTLPMFFSITSNIGASLADAYFIGRLGTRELAAVSFTFPVVMATSSIGFGIGIGASSVIARSIGGGALDMVRRLATDSLILILIVYLLLAASGILAIEPLFGALGASPDVLPIIRGYMTIWYAGMGFMMVSALGSTVLRAVGEAKIPGIIFSAGALCQVVLDPLFIFGLAGFPRLELQGAAVAMIVSRALALVATLWLMHLRDRLIRLRTVRLRALLRSWRQVLAVGVPATATNMIGPVSIGFVVSLLARFGEETVAGFGIASRIESMAVIPLFALSASIGPFVGQNWGAGAFARVQEGLRLGYLFSLAWGGIAVIGLSLVPELLAGLFTGDSAVVGAAALYLVIVPMSYGAWGCLMMASASFNALGHPIPSTVMAAARMLGLYVPLAYAGGLLFGPAGVFAAAAVSNLALGLAAYAWNRRGIRSWAAEERRRRATAGIAVSRAD